MKTTLIILILLIAVSLSADWVTKFDNNSWLHGGICCVLTVIPYTISKAYIVDNRVWNSVIGGTFAMAVGVKKEYHDADNSFDWDGDNYRDLRDDLIGTSLGIVSMQLLEPFSIEFFDGHYFLTMTIYL